MRNWTDSQLDSLYEIAVEKPGWLSKLQENMNVSEEDAKYLIWRDDNDAPVKEWEDEIVRECGLFSEDMTLPEKFSSLNRQISEIEKASDEWTGDNRFLFLGLSPLEKLRSLRNQIKRLLLAQEIPFRKEAITDTEIEYARTVPLERLIANLPKHRKIKCPYHKEESASFHVYHVGYCFGCGIYVDSIKWSMDQLGLSFIQAVKGLGVIGK